MKIESTDQDIRTLLSSGYFRIPRFQRPYSWDRENIEDFWEDIVKERPVDYFIGSMVVYKAGSQSYGVVDGQQRLTTITILLCVLRDRLDKLELVDLASGIQNLVERRNIDNKEQFILSTESSFPFFQDYIQKRGKPEIPVTPHKEEDNLQNAYDCSAPGSLDTSLFTPLPPESTPVGLGPASGTPALQSATAGCTS